MPETTITAQIRQGIAHINLRGDATDDGFRVAVEGVIEQPLPVEPNTMSIGEHQVFWLGPDEWLVTSAAGDRTSLAQAFDNALASMHAASNDVSGGNVVVRLAGERTRDLFAKGCTLDFNPDAFPVGACAQSGLGKANVLVGFVDAGPTFDVVVRRSFSDYLVKWLRHSGSEFGIEFG